MFPYHVCMYQDQLTNLLLLDACITESMRLASGSLVMRIVQRPCSITLNSGNTYHFRKGDRVGIAPPITHHDSEVYHDAHKFIPARWLSSSDVSVASIPHAYSASASAAASGRLSPLFIDR